MKLLTYIIYRAFGEWHEKLPGLAYMVLHFSQIMAIGIPFLLLQHLNHKAYLIIHQSGILLVLVFFLTFAFNIYYYFRESALEKICIKYSNKYKFIENNTVAAFWLFVFLPFVLLLSFYGALAK